eukprot:5585099-Alexandrium_andersonii.AAC.1
MVFSSSLRQSSSAGSHFCLDFHDRSNSSVEPGKDSTNLRYELGELVAVGKSARMASEMP